MRNKFMSHVLMIATVGVLAPVAGAQPANVAAGARAAVPALPPAAPTVSAGASAAGAANAAVHTPVLPPQAQAGAGAGGSAGAAGLNANAGTHASAQGQARGLAVADVATDPARATLRMDETVRTIRAADFAAREQMAADVSARLDASTKRVDDLEKRAESAGDKSRSALARALTEVRQQEKEVRANLRASTMLKDENAWGPIQSGLAKSYGAYAKAVAEAEVAAAESGG